MNKLLYGDNLEIMQGMDSESIDLIYLDPPFNSNRTYNMVYSTLTGKPINEVKEAFNDTWGGVVEDYDELMLYLTTKNAKSPDVASKMIRALKDVNRPLYSYLAYMTKRLCKMKRILKSTGSIYLHCDPTASHYLKIVMDCIFGQENFRNEVVWCYTAPANVKNRFPRKHDIILFYAKSKNYFFTFDNIKIPYNQETVARTNRGAGNFGLNVVGDTEERHKNRLDADGKVPEDYWIDIPRLQGNSKERLGYPTQKPIALLERIIKASCPPDGVVFDPFCGCGTTVAAAHLLGRKWIGCDITITAINLVDSVLKHRYDLKVGIDYEIKGIPNSWESAKALSISGKKNEGRHQFAEWIIDYVGGVPNPVKTGDRGVDGWLYVDIDGEYQKIPISVKSGENIGDKDIRDLKGVLDDDSYWKIGCFITLYNPTKAMERTAREAEYCTYQGIKYPRIQILTVEQIMIGKMLFRTPSVLKNKISKDIAPMRTWKSF
jgi:site-specific DNA-methyltransferase (adenine-specific)